MKFVSLDFRNVARNRLRAFAAPGEFVVEASNTHGPTFNLTEAVSHGFAARRAREALRVELFISNGGEFATDRLQALCALWELGEIARRADGFVSICEVVTSNVATARRAREAPWMKMITLDGRDLAHNRPRTLATPGQLVLEAGRADCATFDLTITAVQGFAAR